MQGFSYVEIDKGFNDNIVVIYTAKLQSFSFSQLSGSAFLRRYDRVALSGLDYSMKK